MDEFGGALDVRPTLLRCRVPRRGSLCCDQQRQDTAAQDYPLLRQALVHYRAGGHEALFESGLGLLIAGAEARLASER